MKRADLIVHQQEPFNAEPPRSALADATLTPLDAFYVRSHGVLPEPGAAGWPLRVDGLVERELELSIEELRDGRFRERVLVATLQCAGNRRAGLIEVRDIPGEAPWGPAATGTASWRGVALCDVLAAAGVGPRASHVAFVGADPCEDAVPPQPYGVSIPLRKALSSEVLLAWEMNGEPLAPEHGAPLRAVVPGYVGARSAKWLRRVEVRAHPWDGYFQATAYRLLPADGEPGPGVGMALSELPLSADVLNPDDGERVAAGSLEVLGYALAGGSRYVARVDGSTDGGAPSPRPSCWRTWGAGPGDCGVPRSSWRRARTRSSRGRGTAPAPPSPRTRRASGTPRGT